MQIHRIDAVVGITPAELLTLPCFFFLLSILRGITTLFAFSHKTHFLHDLFLFYKGIMRW